MDNFFPTVGVITTFLNEEKFLAEAVESVLEQTYPNLQLILVDDGSTDKSESIARRFVNKHPGKISYFSHGLSVNLGLSASRNLGIKKSSADLIAFLDADDVWAPEKIDEQVKIFKNDPEIAMLCEASCYWYSWADANNPDTRITVGNFEEDRIFRAPQLLDHLYPLSDGAAPCPSGIMVKRDVLKKHGGFEEEFRGILQLYEDQAFLHKIYLNETVYISTLCNNKYRQRNGSIVQSVHANGNYSTVRDYFLKWLQHYIRVNHLGNKEVNRIISNAIKSNTFPSTSKIMTEKTERFFSSLFRIIRRR